MKINLLSSLLFISASLFLASCGGSKKAASAPASTEISDIDAKVAAIVANSAITEKSADLKGAEKGQVSIFTNEKGEIVKVSKKVTTSTSEKLSEFFYDGSNLIHSSHFERNTAKEKGKIVFTSTKHYFGNSKVLSAVQKSVTLKPADEANLEMKMNKAKFKAYPASSNLMRDELAIIKKIKQLVK